MKARLYQVDAFASRAFEGNPAAVVPLEKWLDDDVMQAIAAENNLAETAFYVPEGEAYRLRWFTPAVEVPLCGHATLASAHVLFTHRGHSAPEIHFETLSGRLTVKRDGTKLAMDFPADQIKPHMMHETLPSLLGRKPILVMKGKFLVCLYGSASEVAALHPNMPALKHFCETQGGISVICMAEGDKDSGIDFVSRMFAPAKGIDEDPVTGSAHCSSVPYWAKKLGKTDLVARQISRRGGTLWCTDAGERVIMRGTCVDYLQGEIEV